VPVFTYIARSRAGEKVEGSVTAPDRHAALALVERQGLVPMVVKERSAEAVAAARRGRPWLVWRRDRGPRMGGRDVLLFTTELGDLLASGMKLGNALNTLSRRRTHRGEDLIITALRDDIIRGASLSDALGQFRETFSPLYISMVRAGEASGALPEVMQRLVKSLERLQEVKERVAMALVYPSIVLAAGFGTLIFSMTFVVPRFAMVFKDLGSTLPLPTRILIALSEFAVRYGWILAALAVVGVLALRKYLRTDAGRLAWHGLQLRIPLIRGIVMASSFAQFARTLSMLIANGVPVLDALAIVERTSQNAVIAREIRNARDRVTDGTTISGPLAAGKVFPPVLTDMMAIGEETGDMGGALTHVAVRYENELDRAVKVFTTVLEPALIVLMAVIVGFVAISILLAVFDLTSGLNV
jgi:type II secretory pathway component PulF